MSPGTSGSGARGNAAGSGPLLPCSGSELCDPLQRLLHQPLDLVVPLLLSPLMALLGVLRPLRILCAGPTESLDTVRNHKVQVGLLHDLDAAWKPDVAFVELHPLVELQRLDEGLPLGLGRRLQHLNDDARTAQSRESHRVVVDGYIRAVQLRDQQVHQDHNGGSYKDEDSYQQGRLELQVPVVVLVHLERDREQRHYCIRDVPHLEVFVLEHTDGTSESQQKEEKRSNKSVNLRQYLTAHEGEGRQAGRENSQVHQEKPVDGHCEKAEHGVPPSHVLDVVAVRRGKVLARRAEQHRLVRQHAHERDHEDEAARVSWVLQVSWDRYSTQQ
mmetsp:Transcript_31422/g.90163  ORF Transcript_31422/g.90163 Transcript_31422/m.90163 type:complete len:330 (-) Transcript_31422:1087-2076(-)